jgi:hypothetical protein
VFYFGGGGQIGLSTQDESSSRVTGVLSCCVPIHLYLYNWPLLAAFGHEWRPELDLYGTFGDSKLIMEDRGSLARWLAPFGRTGRWLDHGTEIGRGTAEVGAVPAWHVAAEMEPELFTPRGVQRNALP